jgi:hypothetical protein
MYASAFGQKWGAYLMLGGFFTHFFVELTIGVRAYRDVMSRPWPKVVPLSDDDDDW